jgi:sterol 24-C-methyltransferase
MTSTQETLPGFIRQRGVSDKNADIGKCATDYRDQFEKVSEEDRKKGSLDMVNQYYDLATDFYTYGWGTSFHFAPRYQGESFNESLIRHEHYLALRANWKAGMKLIDLGCGVGGPLRNIARFTRASITGVNNNAYQIECARRYDKRFGLEHLADYVKGDFNQMPFSDASIDGAYTIEASCHAADRVKLFKEVLRVLKPGAAFVGYEWNLTSKYDQSNAEHRKIKHQIELGNGLPALTHLDDVKKSLETAGFQVVEFVDICQVFENGKAKAHTWYEPLEGSYTSLAGLRSTPLGRWVTRLLCSTAETLRLTPAGATATSDILEEAAIGLVRGGQLQIFSPCIFFLAIKPDGSK